RGREAGHGLHRSGRNTGPLVPGPLAVDVPARSVGSVSNNFDETFPRPQAGPFGVVREDGDQERVTVLVAAFEGWNDAGDAATDAVQFLATHYGAKDVFEVTSDDYYDYQFSRPLVRRGATGDVK